MQPSTEIEVVFCDLCGASVPASDLATQKAVPFQGKVVGACCLGPLRSAAPGHALTGPRSAADGRLLPIAAVLAAAIAAAALYLDGKIADAQIVAIANRDLLEQRLGANSEALQQISMATDGAARREHVDVLTQRVELVERSLLAAFEQGREGLEQVRQQVAGLQRDSSRREAAQVDYRPLFDDLRAELRRQGAVLGELRVAPVAAPGETTPVPPPAEAAPAPTGLSPALQAQIARLASTDIAVRFEAVDELARSKDPLVLPALLGAARDADAFVRRLTVEVLRDFRAAESVDALLAALGDDNENVRDTAARSLRELTGQKLPFDATASKDARTKAVQKWQEWWEKARPGFGT